MRKVIFFALALMTALFTAVLAADGPRDGQGAGPGDGPGIMGAEGVFRFVDELKLTDEQETKVADLQKESQAEMQKNFEKMRANQGEQPDWKKMGEEMKAQQAKTQKKVEELLEPKQLERIKQIQLQMKLQMPGSALSDPELAKDLDLTDQQKEKIKSLGKDAFKGMGGMRRGGGMPSADDMKKMQKALKDQSAKYLNVLTKEQKEKLETLKGEAFDVC